MRTRGDGEHEGAAAGEPGAPDVPVRLLIGVASLPLGLPVELEVIFEVKE